MSLSKKDFSGGDSDDGLNDDLKAPSRCSENPIATSALTGSVSNSSSSEDSDMEDDLQRLRSIQERFSIRRDMKNKPQCGLSLDSSDGDDCEDDYETIRAIHRRFAAYAEGRLEASGQDTLSSHVQVGASIVGSEKETSHNIVERTNAQEGFLDCVDASEPPVEKSKTLDGDMGRYPPPKVEQSLAGGDELAPTSSDVAKSAMIFVDAIKKNRRCQKILKRKMVLMEARIEELREHRVGVKILRNFQISCKKTTRRVSPKKKDPRLRLISAPKSMESKKSSKKKISALCKGPPENLQVAKYREAFASFVGFAHPEKWSLHERENLVKGVKQQFQGMLLQRCVDITGNTDGQLDSNIVDSITSSIKDYDVTPKQMRAFLPKVNWDELVAMYLPNRSGAECQSRFLNFEDPLINHNPWEVEEDKNLLYITQKQGISNWIEIAVALGTNRTPFQCVLRYQRSLNPSILKREWTKDEDDQLRAAVETYGESNWQPVARAMGGRTGTQCSNRWSKTLHPTRKKVGRWTKEEDKRLQVAVALFGPKTWKEVARCVPGRTHVQCRERWVNCLDPSINTAPWTEEEDTKLKAAFAEHGNCWSKVAACVPKRTDNHCLRRWKALFPKEVPVLQATRMIQKVAFISNFVDRQSERPALGPKDFALPETYLSNISQKIDPPKRKRRPKGREAHQQIQKDCLVKDPISTNGEVGHVQGKPKCGRRKRSDGLNSEPVADASTNKRASKIQPRPKRQCTSKATPNTSSKVVTQVGKATVSNTSRKRKQTRVTDDPSPSSPNPKLLNIKKECQC